MIIAEEVIRPAETKEENKTETPVEETPTEETPVEETPAEETPVEETPTEETPVEETPAEETPMEETPAEETTGEEPANEENPVEEEAQVGPKFLQQDIYRKKVYLTPEQCAQKALETLVLNKQIETKKAERMEFLANFDKKLQEFDREIAELEEKASEQGRIALNGEDFDDTLIDVYEEKDELICVLRGKSVENPDNIVAKVAKK